MDFVFFIRLTHGLISNVLYLYIHQFSFWGVVFLERSGKPEGNILAGFKYVNVDSF